MNVIIDFLIHVNSMVLFSICKICHTTNQLRRTYTITRALGNLDFWAEVPKEVFEFKSDMHIPIKPENSVAVAKTTTVVRTSFKQYIIISWIITSYGFLPNNIHVFIRCTYLTVDRILIIIGKVNGI